MNYQEYFKELLTIIHSLQNDFLKFLSPIVQKHGLNIPQTVLLISIKGGCAENIGSICKKLNMNQGNVSMMCKKLEQAGLLTKTRCNDDERIVSISLTEKGNAQLEEINNEIFSLTESNEYIKEEKLQKVLSGFRELSLIFNSFNV